MRALVGHDDVGERVVERLALRVEPLEAAPVGGERPSAAPAARPRRVDVDVDPDDEVIGERLAHGRRADRAAPECQDTRPGVAEQLERDALLGRPERGLAIGREHLRDRLAEPAGDHVIDVDRARAQRLGRGPGGGRLAGAHEADHRHHPVIADRGRDLLYARRHPIRFS